MASSGQRDSAPIVLRIKLRYEDPDLFVRQLFRYVNRMGMFLRSPRPKPAGKRLIVSFKLADGESVLEFEGFIRWVKPPDGSMGPPGMGVEFMRVSPATRTTLGKILQARAQQGLPEVREIPFSPEGFELPKRRARSAPPTRAGEDKEPAKDTEAAEPGERSGVASGPARQAASQEQPAPEPSPPPRPSTSPPRPSTSPPLSSTSPPRPSAPPPQPSAPPPRPSASPGQRQQAAALMRQMLAQAAADVAQPDTDAGADLDSLLKDRELDMQQMLARARALVAAPAPEQAFDTMLADALASVAVPEGPRSVSTPSSAPAPTPSVDVSVAKRVLAARPAPVSAERAPTTSGKYESPKEVVQRLKRAAAAAKAAAEAEKTASETALAEGQTSAPDEREAASGPAPADRAEASSAPADTHATGKVNKTDTSGQYESPKDVVARLKRAAAKAAQAAAEQAVRAESEAVEADATKADAADRGRAETDTSAAAQPPAAKGPRKETPKEVVARLKRAAAEAAAREEVRAAAEARKTETSRRETPKEVVARLKRAAAEAAAREHEAKKPVARKETPKEVVARLKREAARAAAEATRAEAKAEEERKETPKEVVARLKHEAAKGEATEPAAAEPGAVEPAAAEPAIAEPGAAKPAVAEPAATAVELESSTAAKEPPKEVVARLKSEAARAEFSPPSENQYDISKIPRVDGIPDGVVEVSEPEIRIVADDGDNVAAPAAFTADDDDLLPTPGESIPLSELEPFAAIGRQSDPGELADDFVDIETVDQPGITHDLLDVGAMTGEGTGAPPGQESVFPAGDDFDFDSMFDAAVGPAALRADSEGGLFGGLGDDFGVDLLADEGLEESIDLALGTSDDDGFTVDSLADEPAQELVSEPASEPTQEPMAEPVSEPIHRIAASMDEPAVHPDFEDHSAIPTAVSSELQSGPLDAIPAVLVSEDSKGYDVDFEINSALESLSGNINARPRASDLDFEFDAAFASAVANDPVAEDVADSARAETSSIDISFSDEDDELFDSSGPSGLELALQSDEPLNKRSSQVIASPDAGDNAHDPTMILDDLDAFVQVAADGTDSQSGAGIDPRDSMSIEFDAGALDADGLLATQMPAPGADAGPEEDASPEEISLLEELDLDDEELLVVEDDAVAAPPPPPMRPSAPPPPAPPAPPGPPAAGPPPPRTATDRAASEFGFGKGYDEADSLEDADIKKRGFFGRLFKK